MISAFGDVFFKIFISWKIYEYTNNLNYLVAAYGGSILLEAVFSLVSGKITDSFNRKYLLILSDLTHVLLLLFFVPLMTFDNDVLIYFAVILIIIKSFLQNIFSVSFEAYINDVVPKKHVIKLKAFISGSERFLHLLGGAIAGLLVDRLSVSISILIDASTFLASAYFVSLIKYTYKKESEKNTNFQLRILNVPVSMAAFFSQHIFRNKELLTFVLVVFVGNLAYGFIPEIMPVFAAKNVMGSATFLGIIRGLLAAGELVGLCVVSTSISNRISFCFLVGTCGTVISLVSLTLFEKSLAVFALVFFLYGFFDALTQPYYSYTIANIPTKIRGRVIGVLNALILFSSPVGMYLGSYFIQRSFHLGVLYLLLTLSLVGVVFWLKAGLIKMEDDLEKVQGVCSAQKG